MFQQHGQQLIYPVLNTARLQVHLHSQPIPMAIQSHPLNDNAALFKESEDILSELAKVLQEVKKDKEKHIDQMKCAEARAQERQRARQEKEREAEIQALRQFELEQERKAEQARLDKIRAEEEARRKEEERIYSERKLAEFQTQQRLEQERKALQEKIDFQTAQMTAAGHLLTQEELSKLRNYKDILALEGFKDYQPIRLLHLCEWNVNTATQKWLEADCSFDKALSKAETYDSKEQQKTGVNGEPKAPELMTENIPDLSRNHDPVPPQVIPTSTLVECPFCSMFLESTKLAQDHIAAVHGI